MTKFTSSNRRAAGFIAVALACTVVTACGSDSRSTSTTTHGVAATTTQANTAPQGLPLGRTQQITGTENGGYAATVTVARVWRSAENRIKANVVYDVSRGAVPASKRWTIVERNNRSHVGSVDDTPITGHRESTIVFSTPSNISPSYIRFGDAGAGLSAATAWAVPAMARYAHRTTTTKRTTTKTATRTKSTTRTRRTTTHR
ncbi:hypothetical protein HH308_16425 [Gordonia sp. TBRC 11910]|uniref:Uncharacterized protein n=1 Tax=Gordonia asplenii TaxID=2725283 RepID=A0A848KWW1_9ACTN|nr:hypothetical protein [Gordonia asplenii]NMO02799.1 hypothetical protein [Gordonia asplenii]